MTDQILEKSDNSADVDFADIQEKVSGYFQNGFNQFTKAVKDHPRITLAAGVTVVAGVIAASALPVMRALKERELISA
ncbi:MAG: hypothetical protein JWO15_1584 [Sphingomonadales bacterium]|nr:hypothetical protein [Sphingomonadales bacterium]